MSDSHSPQHSSDSESTPDAHSHPATPIQETRSVLSPVSPKPVHLSQPSDIPVLENQTDPHFNSAEAHPYLAMSNGADTAMSDGSNPQEPPQPAMHDPSTNLFDAMNQNAAHAAAPSGEQSTANGKLPNGAASDAGSRPASAATAPTVTLPSNVDLQALLTKLSPTAAIPQTQQFPPAAHPALSHAIAPQSHAPGTEAAQTPSSTHIPAAPGTIPPQPAASSLPPPPTTSSLPANPHAAYPSSLPPNPIQDSVLKSAEPPLEEEEDRPFTVEEEEEFSRFLNDERDYVSQGQWDRFPSGSRLFIGNLPTEKVTKRDVFRVFRKHGRLAQVSIKQAYGFVQFLDTQSCSAALRAEQGAPIRGRKMHLEVSKPQRNTRDRNSDSTRRRSRSPEYARNRSPGRRGNNRGSRDERGVDRYRSGPSSRDSLERDRDDYRSRNRSPPGRYGHRDDYRPGRRSRSRSPVGRYRGRSPTPDVDDLPLPRRAPGQVPEVQILVQDELDRNFIIWVENAFRARGLTADMLFLSPRLQLSAVVKRQIIEGVMAVVFLNHQSQQTNRITIQIFDRRGEGEATYDQYDNLDPPIAAELVTRSKQAHAPPPVPTATYGYGAPPMAPAANPMAGLPAAALQQLAAIPNVAQLLTSMDPATLQKFLAGLQGQPTPPQHQPYAPPPPQQQQAQDLASLLSRAQQSTPQQAYGQPQHTQQHQQPQQQQGGGGASALAAYGGTQGLAALLGQASQKVQAQQAAQQAQQQGQGAGQQGGAGGPGTLPNIMETLAKWKQS